MIFSVFWKKSFNTNILINHFEYLKLNEISSNSVNFLDLIITYDNLTKTFFLVFLLE